MIDERVAHVDVPQKGIFVIQKVPVELAPLVGTEPLCVANKPEDTKDDNMKLCNISTEWIHLKVQRGLNVIIKTNSQTISMNVYLVGLVCVWSQKYCLKNSCMLLRYL